MNISLSTLRLPILSVFMLHLIASAFVSSTAPAQQSYSDWLLTTAIPDEKNDPQDRNGPLNLTNLEAFAYGVNPLEATLADLPQLREADASLGISIFYRRNTAAQDLQMGFEESQDLSNWQSVVPHTDQVLWTVDDVEGREALVPWDSASTFFLRIAMSLAKPTLLIRVEGGTLPQLSSIGPLEVASYSISPYELTWSEWLEVRDWAVENGYEFDVGEGCSAAHPVQRINWYDIVKWCNAKSEMEALTPAYSVGGEVYRVDEFGPGGSAVVEWNQQADGFRLPTDAEWEYAARGGQLTQNYFFSGSNDLEEVAWWRGNSGGAECALFNPGYPPQPNGAGTWPVGQKLPNELGMYDMSGNVWEWCWDPRDEAVLSRRIRGGSWLFTEDSSLLSSRNSYRPSDRYYYAGFRIAKN